jgi:hypothetical protein
VLAWVTHEAFDYDLFKTGHHFDLLIPPTQVPWRDGWDARSRPVPPNARVIGHTERVDLAALVDRYDLALCQTLEQFELVEHLPIPRMLIVHSVMEPPTEFPSGPVWSRFLGLPGRLGGTVVAFVSPHCQVSWGVAGEVLGMAVDPDDYGDYPWIGDIPAVLTVSHHMTERPVDTGYELHRAVVRDDIPVVYVGDNPGIPGARAACDWGELRTMYRRHRVLLNTTPSGGSLAMWEASMCGTPIVYRAVMYEPMDIVDGLDGLFGETAEELRERVIRCLEDHEFARQVGAVARDRLIEAQGFNLTLKRWDQLMRSAASSVPRRWPSGDADAMRRTVAGMIRPTDQPRAMTPGQTSWVRLGLSNLSTGVWLAYARNRVGMVAVGQHWLDASGEVVAWGGHTTPLPAHVGSGESIEIVARLQAPTRPGTFTVRWDLICHDAFWFSQVGGAHCDVTVEVR